MTVCPDEAQLLRWLESGPDADGRAHLAACEACHGRYAELAAAWEALGEWPVEVPGAPSIDDFAERVLARARREAMLAGTSRFSAALRIAAAVALATSLGSAAALLVPRPARPIAAGVQGSTDLPGDPVAAEHVAEALGLDVLGAGAGALADALDAALAAEEEPS